MGWSTQKSVRNPSTVFIFFPSFFFFLFKDFSFNFTGNAFNIQVIVITVLLSKF